MTLDSFLLDFPRMVETEEAICFQVRDKRTAINFYRNAYNDLRTIALKFGKKSAFVTYPGCRKPLETLSMTLASKASASETMHVASPLVFTGEETKVWDKPWLTTLHKMANAERPQTLIRIRDQRQIWCNASFALLMQSRPEAVVQRSVSRYWLREDFEKLMIDLRDKGSNGNDFEITYRAALNDEGVWGKLTARNEIIELGGEMYRLSTNLASEIIEVPEIVKV
jgi:hypothetical protein